MFTKPTKALQMFEQGAEPNHIDKMDGRFFQQMFTAKCELAFVLTQENVYS